MRLLPILLLSTLASAQTRLYVADSGEDRITVIDEHTNKVVGDIHVSADPEALAVFPDGHRLYAASPLRNALDVIDLRNAKLIHSVSVGPKPAGIAVSPDGRRVFVCIGGGAGIDVIDAASFMKVKHIASGRSMRNIYVTPDQTRMIATSAAGPDLTVINIRTEEPEFEIPAGGVPLGIAIDSDRNLVIGRLFIQLSGDFEAIDYRTRKISGKIPVSGAGIAEAPDHRSLWAGGVIFSLPDLKRVGSYSGNNIAFSPDSKRAFISNTDTDTVSVIDAATYKELTRIPVGGKPLQLVVIQ